MEIKAANISGYQEQGSYSQTARPVEGITAEASEQQAHVSTTKVQPQANAEPKSDSKSKDKDREEESTEKEREQLKKAVADINRGANGTEAIFGIHEKTNRVTIKIVDKETKEVVREVPAEKTLDLIAKAWEMAGILVDEKR